MTMWFYIKTDDTPKNVGEIVCANNVFEDQHPKGTYSWIMQQGKGPEEYWQIMGKYEGVKDLTNVALLYRVGNTIVLGEVDDNFVPNIMDPLLERYGFDNIKYIVSAPKK